MSAVDIENGNMMSKANHEQDRDNVTEKQDEKGGNTAYLDLVGDSSPIDALNLDGLSISGQLLDMEPNLDESNQSLSTIDTEKNVGKFLRLGPLVDAGQRQAADPHDSLVHDLSSRWGTIGVNAPRSDLTSVASRRSIGSEAKPKMSSGMVQSAPSNATCWERCDEAIETPSAVAMQNLVRLSMLNNERDQGQQQQLLRREWEQQQQLQRQQMTTNLQLLASLNEDKDENYFNTSTHSSQDFNNRYGGNEPCFGLEHLRQRSLLFQHQPSDHARDFMHDLISRRQQQEYQRGQQVNRNNHLSRYYPGAEVHNPLTVRANFGQLGSDLGFFDSPHGFCLNSNDDVVVADTGNHRVQVFNKEFRLLFSFGIPGKEDGCLWQPRKVAVTKQLSLFVVCDRGNSCSRMQLFMPDGRFFRRIDIRMINIVAGLAIDKQDDIVVVDSVTPTIYFFNILGELMRYIDCCRHVAEPSDIAIWTNSELYADFYYLSDFKAHCVVMLNEDGELLRRIGGQDYFSYPNGVDISGAGDVVVGDSHGNQFHIALFNKMGEFLGHFTCRTVKVSRCCGLRLNGDGLIVTVAKNNHHVLVMNTIYAPKVTYCP